MEKDQQEKQNIGASMNQGFAGTNPQKVKQEIQKDVTEGRGAMTSREAGAMND